jgi:hypothetical protein
MLKLLEYAFACNLCNSKKSDHNEFYFKDNMIQVNLDQYEADQKALTDKNKQSMCMAGILHFQLMADLKNLVCDDIINGLILQSTEFNDLPRFEVFCAFSILKFFFIFSKPIIKRIFTEINQSGDGSNNLNVNNAETFNSTNTLHTSNESINELLGHVMDNAGSTVPNVGSSSPLRAPAAAAANVELLPLSLAEENISNSTTRLRGYLPRMELFKPEVSKEEAEQLIEEVFNSF